MSYFFNPYMMGYNANRFRGVHRLDFGGIPFVRTSSVTTDTTNSEVIYGISPCLFRRLPNQGILLLSVNHVPAAGSDGYLVSVATTLTNTTSTSTSKVPLVNGSGDQKRIYLHNLLLLVSNCLTCNIQTIIITIIKNKHYGLESIWNGP